MKNIANADRPKSAGAMLPPRPLRRSGKVAQTACNSDRREGKSCIPTLNQTFADSRILKISKFPTFRIAGVKYEFGDRPPTDIRVLADELGGEFHRSLTAFQDFKPLVAEQIEAIEVDPGFGTSR